MQLHRCTSILILFFCSLVASCGKSSGSDAPKEGPAGQVQVVQGLVQATRSGQSTRDLSAGDTIYVDDSLESGEGASAVIVFGHNNATWQLSAGYKGKVVDSLPWRTKRHRTSALVRAEQTQTAAAGRNSEREAAESIETMQPNPVMPAMEEKVAAADEAPMVESPAAQVPTKTASARRGERNAASRIPAPQPSAKPKRNSEPESISVGRGLGIANGSGAPGGTTGSPKAMGMGGTGSGGGGTSTRGGASPNAGKGQHAAAAHVTEAAPVPAAPSPAGPSPGADAEEADLDMPSPERRERKNAKQKFAKKEADTSLLSRSLFLKQMRSVGKSCQSKYGGKGKVLVHLMVEKSKIKTLAIKGTSQLSKVAKCMNSKLRSHRNEGSFSVKTSITFASQ